MAGVSVATANLQSLATRARAAAASSPALRAALPPFLAAKTIALLIPVLVVWSTSDVHGHPSYSDFVRPFGYWDGATYIDIEQHGYPAGHLDLVPGHPGHLWGFFPGLPLLLKAGTFIFRDVTSTGILINIIGEFFALFFLARLVLLERNGDVSAARFACWMLALFPDAVFLSVIYTDSVFLAAAMGCVYYMRRGDNGYACIAAAVAIAMRITGLALIPVLLFEYLRRRRWRPGLGVLDISIALSPVVLFCWYAWLQTGDFFAYKTAQPTSSFSGGLFPTPWNSLRSTWEIGHSDAASSYDFLWLSDAVWGVAGFIALCYLALNWRRYPASLTLFAAGVWLLSTSQSYWQGMMRYEMAFIPVYLVGADLYRRHQQLATVLLTVSGAWMVFQTHTFATGRFIV